MIKPKKPTKFEKDLEIYFYDTLLRLQQLITFILRHINPSQPFFPLDDDSSKFFEKTKELEFKYFILNIFEFFDNRFELKCLKEKDLSIEHIYKMIDELLLIMEQTHSPTDYIEDEIDILMNIVQECYQEIANQDREKMIILQKISHRIQKEIIILSRLLNEETLINLGLKASSEIKKGLIISTENISKGMKESGVEF